MSQPNSSENREPDPLLAFFEEAATPQPVESREPVPRLEARENAPDPPAAAASEANPETRRRLDRAERQIDRTLIDITTLKGDLATLVSAVDDIKKRMSRPAANRDPVVAQPSRNAPWRRAIAALVILLTAGAVFWGLLSVTTYDLPEPPPLANDTSSAVESPAVVEPQPAPAPLVQVVQAGSARAAPAAARAAPAPASRVVNYVGALTVDAEPAGDVYLNRQSVGRTPVRLENLRAGSHLIWIEREGYRRWTRVVAVAADRVSRVTASLDPISR